MGMNVSHALETIPRVTFKTCRETCLVRFRINRLPLRSGSDAPLQKVMAPAVPVKVNIGKLSRCGVMNGSSLNGAAWPGSPPTGRSTPSMAGQVSGRRRGEQEVRLRNGIARLGSYAVEVLGADVQPIRVEPQCRIIVELKSTHRIGVERDTVPVVGRIVGVRAANENVVGGLNCAAGVTDDIARIRIGLSWLLDSTANSR